MTENRPLTASGGAHFPGTQRDNCAACFAEHHAGHDVGWRHENGRLASATCHDCREMYAATERCSVSQVGDREWWCATHQRNAQDCNPEENDHA